MIQHVWERVKQARSIGRIVVATDDARIRDAVAAFGGEALMTRSEHRSGTERVAEVATHLSGEGADIFINVQGDEPLIEPSALDALVAEMAGEEEIRLGTLCSVIARADEIMDPNVVKVVRNFDGDALYFSRAPVPWVRDRHPEIEVRHLKHIGVYAYRREALLEYPALPPGELERIEQLEQLRWLENGFPMRVVECEYNPVSVDVPGDVAKVEARIRKPESP
jgi:3-deoxy-manno-octulosonate cytidylyltransferase (CMP-KDO synthetase)